MMYGYGWGPGFGLFGGLFMLIFWVLIIWLIVALVRGASGHGGKHCWGGMCGGEHEDMKKDTAMEVLRERFAKGEISKEEFEEKSAILKK